LRLGGYNQGGSKGRSQRFNHWKSLGKVVGEAFGEICEEGTQRSIQGSSSEREICYMIWQASIFSK